MQLQHRKDGQEQDPPDVTRLKRDNKVDPPDVIRIKGDNKVDPQDATRLKGETTMTEPRNRDKGETTETVAHKHATTSSKRIASTRSSSEVSITTSCRCKGPTTDDYEPHFISIPTTKTSTSRIHAKSGGILIDFIITVISGCLITGTAYLGIMTSNIATAFHNQHAHNPSQDQPAYSAGERTQPSPGSRRTPTQGSTEQFSVFQFAK